MGSSKVVGKPYGGFLDVTHLVKGAMTQHERLEFLYKTI